MEFLQMKSPARSMTAAKRAMILVLVTILQLIQAHVCWLTVESLIGKVMIFISLGSITYMFATGIYWPRVRTFNATWKCGLLVAAVFLPTLCCLSKLGSSVYLELPIAEYNLSANEMVTMLAAEFVIFGSIFYKKQP